MVRISRKKNFQQGFTLLEIIVALAIIAVVGAIAAAALEDARKNKETFDRNVQALNAIESFWNVLATDLNHATNLKLPSVSAGIGANERPPAFMGGDPTLANSNFLLGEYFLRFTRDGWTNPLQQPRSDMQRVAYRIIDGNLWREYWPEQNQPFDNEPLGRRLIFGCVDVVETIDDNLCENAALSKVDNIAIRFLPQNADKVIGGPWQDVWPPSDSQFRQQNWQLPLAVEITLAIDTFGEVQRIFSLPGL